MRITRSQCKIHSSDYMHERLLADLGDRFGSNLKVSSMINNYN